MDVIVCANRVYEITSWNEQGEITRIETMLVIDFSISLPCSHRDTKPIKRIIFIHCLTSMVEIREKRIKKQYDSDKYNLHDIHIRPYGREKSDIDFLKEQDKIVIEENEEPDLSKKNVRESNFLTVKENEKIKSLEYQIKELEKEHMEEIRELQEKFKQKLKQSEKEIQKKKRQIFDLKERLGKNPKWKKRGNTYYRDDNVPSVILPRNFNLSDVDIKKYNKSKTKIFYQYPGLDKLKEMPVSLYDQLCEGSSDLSINDVNDLPSMKKYIYSIDKDAKTEKKYFNRVATFSLNHRDSKFKFEELHRQIKFKGKQSGYNLLHEFEKWGFIKQDVQGYYIVIF